MVAPAIPEYVSASFQHSRIRVLPSSQLSFAWSTSPELIKAFCVSLVSGLNCEIPQFFSIDVRKMLTKLLVPRIIEDEGILATIEARTEALQTLRELGPPDLINLVKQSTKAGGRQVCTL